MSFPSALLFDLDGTLIDSHGEISHALERALLEQGIDLGGARVAALVDGSPLEVIWQKLDAEHRTDSPAYTRFAASYRAHYGQNLGHASPLFPGVLETLGAIARERPEVALCVVSNKPAATVQALLDICGIAHHFRLATGAGGSHFPPKPAPQLLFHAAAHVGVEPSRCIMVGDTVSDIQAGKRAGMKTVALSYGMATQSALVEAEPDHLFDDFRQVRSVLAACTP